MHAPSIDFAIVVLLTTTFVTVGLVGLWAGVSRWHWFVRCAVVLVVLAPVALIPAYEALLLLLIQLVVIAIVSRAYLKWVNSQEHSTKASYASDGTFAAQVRFSLTDIFLLVLLVALALFIVVQMTREELHGWRAYLFTGAMMGITVLASAWTVSAKANWISRAIAIVIIITLATLYSPMKLPANFKLWPNLEIATWPTPPVVIGVALVIAADVVLLRKAGITSFLGCTRAAEPPSDTLQRRMARFAFSFVFIVSVAPPAIACWKLLHPLPQLRIQPPEPNGYDILASAGQMFTGPILYTDAATASTEQLANEIHKYTAACERVRLGLSLESVSPRWSSDKTGGETVADCLTGITNIRNVARALSMEFELARRENRFEDAATIAVDNIRLGASVTRYGVFVEYLTGVAIESIGRNDLYSVAGELGPASYRELLDDLSRLESQREPFEAILHRDRIWNQHAFGWQGHLCDLLSEAAGGDIVVRQLHNNIHPKHVAASRLMLTELALRCYFADRGEFPNDLKQLVPEYVPAVPQDPFSTQGAPLLYRRLDDGYVVYSLGQNRTDDGGARQDTMSNSGDDWNTGDLRLEYMNSAFRT